MKETIRTFGKTLALGILTALPLSAAAIPIEQTLSGSFSPTIVSQLSGYRYEYSIRANLSVGQLSPTVTFSERQTPAGNYGYSLVLDLLNVGAQPPKGEAFEADISVTLRFSDAATGQQVDLPSLYRYESFSVTAIPNVVRVNEQPRAITFSFPKESGSTELALSGIAGSLSATAGAGQRAGIISGHGKSFSQVDATTSFSFVPGNYLAISQDPLCASFECLPAGRDEIEFQSYRLVINGDAMPVPEPSTLLATFCGLVVCSAYVRHNRGRRVC